MFFKDILGKEQQKRSLIAAVKEEKIPHAQMLLGKSGCGHLPLGLALASYILCLDRKDDDSCGQCTACIKSHKYAHPDLHFAFPVVKYGSQKRDDTTSNTWLKEWRSALLDRPFMDINGWQMAMDAQDSQPNINKKECVDIVHKLGMKPFESDSKVLVLWMPEYLQKEGNRLLKLIEEPTPNTIIIMVADRQEDILNTIISRVQITKIPPFTVDEIGQILTSTTEIDEVSARQIGVMADGNLGRAFGMVHGQLTDYSDALFDWIRIAYKMEPVALNSWIDEAAKWGRDGQKNFLEYGLHFFREYLYWLMSGSEELKLSSSEIETANKMTSIIDMGKAEKIVLVLDKAYKAIGRNANPKIEFMADSMKIAYILRSLSKAESIYST